jgi:hypothetical protein
MAMTTQTWHVGPDVLQAYVAGSLDAVHGASVEQHLTRCADCRLDVRPLVDTHALDRAWSGVRDTIQSPPQPLAIRLARRLGLPEPTSVVLAATVSLRTSWLAGALVALTFAVLAVELAGEGLIAPFLLVAPMVPVLGVAAAYGSAQDPLESLVVTAPYGRSRLILVRTVAVLVSVLPVTAAFGFLLPGPTWLAAAWLGPALTLVPVLLAVSSFVGPRTGGALVAIGWCGVVLLSVRELPATWPVAASQQLVYLALAAVSGLVLLVRSRRDQIGATL